MALSSARWSFLAPWCGQLKGKLYYGRLAVKGGIWDTQRHTLHVTIRREFSGANTTLEEEKFQLNLRKIRESLALLAAVEYVDSTAWKFLLTTYCGIDIGKEGEEKFDESIPVKFLLCLEFEGKNDNYDLVKFCGVDQRDNPSEEYLEILAKIAALAKQVQPGWRGVDIQIPVHVFFSTDRIKPMDLSAKELINIGKAENIIMNEWQQHANRSKVQIPGSLRCTFVLEPVVVDFLGMRMNASMVKTMETLVRSNVWFSQVKRVRLELDKELWDDELESKKVLGQLFSGLFNSTRRNRELAIPRYFSPLNTNNPTTSALQLEHAQLFCPAAMPASDFVALASSIAVNQTIQKLEISLVPQSLPQTTTRLWWTWLAYALFSKRAQLFSSLECIEIAKLHHMTTADLEKFIEVLTSEHPEEMLFNSPRGEVEEKTATVTSGAAIRWQFNYRGEPLPGFESLSFPSPIPFVRTFSDNGVSEWVSVLIPGYGRCQVQRDNLEFHESSEIEARPRLATLKIGFINERHSITDGLPLFLAAVGPSLKSFMLEGRNLDLNINRILHSCPNLLELSLSGAVVDVQLKFNHSHELCPPLPELDVDWDNVVALSRALSNGNNPLAKCVHRLRVHPMSEADLNALLDMLTKNQALKYVEVISPALFQRYIDKFRKFNAQPTYHTLKLSLKSKVAFIRAASVIERRSPLNGLGQDVLCKIFAYAASPVPRQVFFRSEHIYLG